MAGAASLDALEVELGGEGHTVAKYPGQFGGTAAKRSHQIDIPRRPQASAPDAVRESGIKPETTRDPGVGEDSYRIDFGRGKRAQATGRRDGLGEKLGVAGDRRGS